ncbi:hypothetical protein Cfor_12741 [Coptotermes formosanus]|uniref:GH18 domain-containing protein n=1 Tax=Coptotermes formosanus TaxID=36987 RepID=A0A6L2PXH9_COPFO|nr:hypothetical protein Cfor_12741 [Coptotermes formosanus]
MTPIMKVNHKEKSAMRNHSSFPLPFQPVKCHLHSVDPTSSYFNAVINYVETCRSISNIYVFSYGIRNQSTDIAVHPFTYLERKCPCESGSSSSVSDTNSLTNVTSSYSSLFTSKKDQIIEVYVMKSQNFEPKKLVHVYHRYNRDTLCISGRIVCYFESWATYRPGSGKFDVELIDPNLCTHLIYSFVGINSNAQVTILDPWNDIDLGAIRRFNALRNQNPNLKTMAAIGGATAGSDTFSQVVNSATSRAKFADNIVNFAKQYGFNGIDLDWEYPTNEVSNNIKLLKLLRPKFDSNGLILSAAVSAGFDTIDASYNVPALGQYLDFINVMTYDLHGPWDSATGENAPLYAGPSDKTAYLRNLNADSAIQYWIQKGAPKDKLNLGIGTYGRSFTLKSASNNGVGASTTGAGQPGPYTQESGYLGYNEICEAHIAGNLEQHWNAEQKSAYAFHGDQWVGYDNIAAVRIKAEYITSSGLGGAMVWAIDTDDFRNICGDGRYPLINTIKTYLG